jgi:hypothetical protein
MRRRKQHQLNNLPEVLPHLSTPIASVHLAIARQPVAIANRNTENFDFLSTLISKAAGGVGVDKGGYFARRPNLSGTENPDIYEALASATSRDDISSPYIGYRIASVVTQPRLSRSLANVELQFEDVS